MQRSGREGLSVFVRNRKTETTDKAVVVLSRNDTRKGQPEGYAVMTAYSGDLTPREPWDAWFTGGYTELEKNKRKVLRQEAFEY